MPLIELEQPAPVDPYGPPDGFETIEWVDAIGNAVVLTRTKGVTGRWLPPVRYNGRALPDAGEFEAAISYGPVQIVVPVLIMGASGDEYDYRLQVRALARAFDIRKPLGMLRSTLPDGSQRILPCRYIDGMGFAEDYRYTGEASLLFRAAAPFWTDPADMPPVVYQLASTPVLWFPILPLVLNASTVFATGVITNDGDVDAWPVWTITGSGSSFALTNTTTGQVLDYTLPVAAGQQIIVDTRPGYKTITDANGNNLYAGVGASAMWPLIPGANSVSISYAGATSDSSVTCSWRRRYLGA